MLLVQLRPPLLLLWFCCSCSLFCLDRGGTVTKESGLRGQASGINTCTESKQSGERRKRTAREQTNKRANKGDKQERRGEARAVCMDECIAASQPRDLTALCLCL